VPDAPQIGELVRALVAELRDAVADTVLLTAEASMRVDGVSVRLWGKTDDEPPWQLDLGLGPRGTVRERFSRGSWQDVPLADPHHLAPGFAELPVSTLKEMSRRHEAAFKKAGVGTLGELAGVSDQQILELVRKSCSHLPLEFRTKARLLAVPPLESIPEAAATHSLYSLFGSGPDELQELVGPELSAAASRRAFGQIALAGLALDEETMRSLTLADLSATA